MNHKQSIQQLKNEGLVTTADKIKLAKIKIEDGMPLKGSIDVTSLINIEDCQITPVEIEKILSRQRWIKEIEDYCSTEGILPSDLISSHRERNKSTLKPKTPKKDIPAASEPVKPSKSNWRKDYLERKTGIKPLT